ncbi:TIGR02444 family protein [Pseudomonas fontis]|uniref:TIGR02444 family protein n=1 Tax=Pseudomonas fontis TaxID=2942633 RepID=A0ABT5NRK7_9PSED|nr:TIGR02444 family protein [Pseudomonas fontis]MDD0976688.1 TIGR02444 family protein [Pseudomonas fontis]MDD0990800.1 TIGR02444 family protein [Pseudomonas fontis]
MHTDLWNFAITLYARPGVEAACLNLQAQGADVCLLLCAAWLDSRQIRLEDPRVEQLRRLAGPWQHDVVQPLRELRRQWRAKAQHDAELAVLREQVKGLEMNAERQLLERLQLACEGWQRNLPGIQQDWLEALTPTSARLHHDALQVLRAAVRSTQDAVDGD